MKNEKLKSYTSKVKMAASAASATSFATPGSVFAMVDNILCAVANARHNKTYIVKFVPMVKQITKVLNGADASFIRHAEFYSDLRETLKKIEQHVKECSLRGKWAKKLMAKKDQKMLEEMGRHIDHLITRIVFSFAQRVELMNIARQKAAQKKLNFSVIEEEDDVDTNPSESETSSTYGETASLASVEDSSIGLER
ncbi:predicted protein [Nematostella vectensis]|uniref:Uncharacterized protein n=1 Tax=Nematostella vectensis TaxID=45351 RepID=A7RX58_NEMVE|nr:uncharacterized protein LOC5515919 [Nematostella vectensis]EDO43907.1 predicted protein [Nematostella vectensis]|eukprot:XP_001635970.1 predicted protein [Nematostella vectensis]